MVEVSRPVPQDTSLLRRSSRLNADKKDFKDKMSAELLAPLFEGRRRSQCKEVHYPFLSVDLVHHIRVDICKASPSEMSAEALLYSNDD